MQAPPDLLPYNPFFRLGQLLKGRTPGRSPLPDGKPVNLSLGDPRTPMPEVAHRALAEAAAGWSRYAGARGHPDSLKAMAEWLERRYRQPAGLLDVERNLVPVSGSREGLYFATLAAVQAKQAALGGERPLVLLPDPGYHVYGGAALASGAEPHFVPVDAQSGQLPRYASLPGDVLARAAIAFLCSPANPQGAIATAAELHEVLEATRHYGCVLAVDECYSELYTGAAPTGALSVAAETPEKLAGLVAFHSLSKRSGAPGLRLGFVAGDAPLLRLVEGHLRFGGAGFPLPVLAAGAALWRDETHVEANRAYYNRNLELAERILGPGFGWRRPAGGFFGWLDISSGRCRDGVEAALRLYEDEGILALPGSYLSQADRPDDQNPGRRFLRLSLAEPPEILEPVLTRLSESLL
jgi:aspartate/methionine/tyrosine aminotransferase